MERKKLLIRIVVLMFVMFSLYLIENKFHWYYSIWWFDMLMHFLGGLWVGLFFIYAYRLPDLSFSSILKVILSVLAMGVLWEIFEFYVFNRIGLTPFSLTDTLSDIFFDLAGGLSALFYLSKKIMFIPNNTV